MNTLKVLLVEDHQLVRQGLRSLIEAQGITVVGEVSTCRAALEQVKATQPMW